MKISTSPAIGYSYQNNSWSLFSIFATHCYCRRMLNTTFLRER
ncbi:hypothetical protein VAEKB19_5150004 [Vibrio aestuarianus]|nr:hypothetical protein VAEKB19_5150004 [Vibrio aestuarianus]